MAGVLHFSYPADGILLLEIDNPPVNSLSLCIRNEVEKFIDLAQDDLSVRVVIITGRGRGFSAGDDLKDEMARSHDLDQDESGRQFVRLYRKIEQLRVPVIAALNGYVIGGALELVLACDIRVASNSAFFTAAAVNVGLVASVYRLPRLIGIGPATAILLAGDRVDAATALAYGLVTEVHSADALMPAALSLAKRIATRAPLSVETSKRMIRETLHMGAEDAERAQWNEVRALRLTKDHKHAVECILSKVTPSFRRQ